MRLADLSGQILELEILGYQFPDEQSFDATRAIAASMGISRDVVVHDHQFDDNWLIIRGHVEIPRGSWDFKAPCLLTWEVKELCGWFRAATEGQACGPMSFLEPNLSFELSEPMPEGNVRIVATFALEARPPWVTLDDFEASVEFQFHLADVLRAAEELSLNLNEYPERR